MFGIGLGEFLALAVVAMIVLGPEKLPRYAADAARFLRSLRRMADAARADVRRELGPEFDGISISDLNPRTMVRRHLLEPIDLDDLDDDGDRRRRTPGESRARDSRTRAEQRSRRPAQRGGSTGAVNGSKASGAAEPGPAESGSAASGRAASAPAASAPAAAEDAAGGIVDDRPPYDPDTT